MSGCPEQNRGDLNAQIACVNIGERKVIELVDRFGRDFFDNGHRRAARLCRPPGAPHRRDIPDGEYFFADYADEDSV